MDISAQSIRKAVMLFRLLEFLNDEELKVNFKLKTMNSLNINIADLFSEYKINGFDYVVGNPPYVRAKNINDDIKKGLKKWSTVSGNTDLYIPFYELGIELLNDNGKLGYISPNTFIQSVNGRELRNYLRDKGYSTYILDFRETQMFKNITNYTCIVLIDKTNIDNIINYALLNGSSSLYDYEFTKYKVDTFPKNTAWRMRNSAIDSNINKIEHVGRKLGDYKIRNGLATLKNDIYFFNVSHEDKDFYYRLYKEKTYRIEKGICIDVAKPNIIKNEKELIEKAEKAIFPYTNVNSKLQILPEVDFKTKYPNAYEFLYSFKEVLGDRDKGKNNYPAWYAYGRTQGMNNFGAKLLIPYIAGEPTAVLSEKYDLLFYCGYALFSDNIEELKVIKCFLESPVFWYYIKHTSKPYANGYMAFAKNYITNFGLPDIESSEAEYLLSISSKTDRNKYVTRLYGLSDVIG